MTARRKKRRENGVRALFLGSKPHSKGVKRSRAVRVRVLRRRASMARRAGISRDKARRGR